jgi:hypothetical protein
MKNYTPKGKAAKIWAHIHANPDQRVFAGAELALIAGADNVVSFLKPLLDHGMLHSVKRGRERLFSLDLFPEDPVDETEFTAALWADGELALSGVRQTEDGVLLTAAQASQVKRLLTGAVA